jgi:hypothetical protein
MDEILPERKRDYGQRVAPAWDETQLVPQQRGFQVVVVKGHRRFAGQYMDVTMPKGSFTE